MSQALSDIVGGKWWKIDFHLHTPASYDYGHGDETAKSITAKQFIEKCRAKNLDCIVVSDHNTFAWVPTLRDALAELRLSDDSEYTDFTIFPGVEINTQGNVHLLGVFDPSTEYEDLLTVFGKFDFDKELESTRKSVAEIIEIINDNGGIAIPAHVDQASGLFKAPSSIVKQALRAPGLLALEVTNEIDSGIYRDLNLHLSAVLGSDSHSPNTIASRYSWVKMGEPNIEALRLALYDTEDGVIRSVKYDNNPNDIHSRTYIYKMTIENGKYIGRRRPFTISFSPWLNSIIGGRGTGKSSILTFIRMALDRGNELPENLKSEFDNFAKVPRNRSDLGMLLNSDEKSTTITICFLVDGIEHTLRWNNNTIEEFDLETNTWQNAVAIHERFPVRMFSQKQLYEMTSDPELLFKYLDTEWDYQAWDEQVSAIQGKYLSLASRKRSLSKKLKRKEELSTQLKDLSRKIEVFETQETKSIFRKKEELQKEANAVKSIYSSFDDFIVAVTSIPNIETIPILEVYDDLTAETKSEVKEWMNQLLQLQTEVVGAVNKYKEHLKDFDALIESITIGKQLAQNKADMESVVEKLRASGVDDIEKYAELLAQKDLCLKEIDGIGDVERQISSCGEQMLQIRSKIIDLITDRIAARRAVIESWNKIGPLRITLLPLANIEKNEATFRSIIRKDTEFGQDILDRDVDGNLSGRGILFPLLTSKVETDAISQLEKIFDLLIGDGSGLGKRFSKHVQQLFENSPESIDEIATWIPEDDLKLEINVKPTGRPDYRDIDAGSPGQRTSAILSLIFGISNMPIIIDQPEDDLDTRNITDIVVNSINQMKNRQQIILVTHNPNIVVNTNSEQITHLDYVNGQIITACAGALQNHNIRDAICEVMEGGKQALEKRYYRIFKALQ